MGVRKSTNLAGVALRRDALKMKEVPGSPTLYVFGLPE
jgi:hypothetical protein